jgi:hypothetical protein
LNGVFAYVEKDMEKRLPEFEGLLDSINFKKIEKEDLLKVS